MGYFRARIAGGMHSAVVQLTHHYEEAARIQETVKKKQAGEAIGFYHAEDALVEQPIIFIELTPYLSSQFLAKSRAEQVKEYKEQRLALLQSINLLFEAERQGLKPKMNPLQRMIVEKKPELVFADVYSLPPLREQEQQELSKKSTTAASVKVGALAAGAAATGILAKKLHDEQKVAEEKGRRKLQQTVRMSRRAFLKRMALVGLGAALGLGVGHELEPTSSWRQYFLSLPGEISGVRELLRKMDVAYTHGITEVRLRNAIVAEKISRFLQQHFSGKPTSVGVVFGTGHGGLKEMLEDPNLRKQTIAAIPNLDQLIHEEFSGYSKRLKYNPKMGLYEMNDEFLGFR